MLPHSVLALSNAYEGLRYRSWTADLGKGLFRTASNALRHLPISITQREALVSHGGG